jgi:hypothetical protein
MVAIYDFYRYHQPRLAGSELYKNGAAKGKLVRYIRGRERDFVGSRGPTYQDWIERTSTLDSRTPADVEGDIRRLFGPL